MSSHMFSKAFYQCFHRNWTLSLVGADIFRSFGPTKERIRTMMSVSPVTFSVPSFEKKILSYVILKDPFVHEKFRKLILTGGTELSSSVTPVFSSCVMLFVRPESPNKQRAKWPNSFIKITGAAAAIKTASSNGSYSIGGIYLLDTRISVQKLRWR